MEQDRMLTLIVIVIIIAGAGIAFILIQQPVDEPYTDPQDVQIRGDSYAIATGEFEAVDVFAGYISEGSIIYGAFAHITQSGIEYHEMLEPFNDYKYEVRNRVCFRIVIYYENNTVSDPYETILIVGYVYTFYVYDVLMTLYYYD